VRTGRQRLDGADWSEVNRRFTEMEGGGRALLARAGVAPGDVRVARIAEMRYVGQGHEVEAAVPRGALSVASLPTITASFEAAYRALYHRLPQGVPIEALNWRLTVSGPDPYIAMAERRAAESGPAVGGTLKGTRRAYFAESDGFVETPVYDRYAFAAGMTLAGPAIIEERESTAVIGPGGHGRVDEGLALVVEVPR